jgi:hypothetical protein
MDTLRDSTLKNNKFYIQGEFIKKLNKPYTLKEFQILLNYELFLIRNIILIK